LPGSKKKSKEKEKPAFENEASGMATENVAIKVVKSPKV
jgi:hypothetical protein